MTLKSRIHELASTSLKKLSIVTETTNMKQDKSSENHRTPVFPLSLQVGSGGGTRRRGDAQVCCPTVHRTASFLPFPFSVSSVHHVSLTKQVVYSCRVGVGSSRRILKVVSDSPFFFSSFPFLLFICYFFLDIFSFFPFFFFFFV